MPGSKQRIGILPLLDIDTLLHLRIPFSFFLLPVFCFAVSESRISAPGTLAIVFLALHLFIYPASNAYNSFMDQDKGSIGGLKNPPPATRKLYYASILFDTAGLLLLFSCGWQYAVIGAGYIMVSKAYSWRGIRLKKRALAGWLTVAVFQGGYIFMLAGMAAQHEADVSWFTAQHVAAMLLAVLIVGGSYPMTQIYQHEEDGGRGDITISYRLGIRGTFLFTASVFAIATLFAFWYFTSFHTAKQFWIFLAFAMPPLLYLSWWFFRVLRNSSEASFEKAMMLNKISSASMIACFVVLYFVNRAAG